MSLFVGLAPTRHFLYDGSATGHLASSWSLLVPDTPFSTHLCIDLGLTGSPVFSSVLWPRSPLPFLPRMLDHPRCLRRPIFLSDGRQHVKRDHKQSSLSFHLERRDILSRSLGGSCPDPPCAVWSGTALPLPLSGGTTLYSSSISLVLGDSCAPVCDPPPVGGGVVVVSRSVTLLVSSSQDCELTVAPVRFAPDCAPVLLFDCLGRPTFHFAI